MIHASTNFSHPVAFRKQPDHKLVTDGIYGWDSNDLFWSQAHVTQVVAPPFVYWIFLLGIRYPTGTPEPAVIRSVYHSVMEVFLLPYS